jgi:hypothetical protein
MDVSLRHVPNVGHVEPEMNICRISTDLKLGLSLRLGFHRRNFLIA